MKTILTFAALIVTVGYPSVALAESTGAHLPDFLNTTTIIAFFSATCLGLLAFTDYTRTHRLAVRSLAKASTTRDRSEHHRLAA